MTEQTQPETADAPVSLFQSNLSLAAKLDRARLELLDMSARNRLLNIPRSAKSATVLEIIDEHTKHIFRLLVQENKAFTFLPGKEAPNSEATDADEITELAQPEDLEVDGNGVAARHVDTRLQTRLTPAGLQKRLLNLYHDARTLEEEQGVNILFLALGTLKWIDPNSPDNARSAPLILVPVSLERGNAAEKFKLRWRQEDVESNLSLEAFMEKVHQLKLPIFEGSENGDPSDYLEAVRDAVSGKAGWEVNPDDIVLGFFSFAKFLMYRDLDPENWPINERLNDHGLVKSLVCEGFAAEELTIHEDADIDQHIVPAQMTHIVDSDSSQTLAVHEVRAGRNLVIQGPPGTGKSQTIANIIASAIVDQKSVLFVAEKMAALEVVKRRLDNTGVGDACLELHSNKSNKRSVLEELRRTWELGSPKGQNADALNGRLKETLDDLNCHAARMHSPLGWANFTPYQVIGHLTRLRQNGQGPTDSVLNSPENWSAQELNDRIALVTELSERITEIGTPSKHIWRGVGITTAYPMDVDRLVTRIAEIRDTLNRITANSSSIANVLEKLPPNCLQEIEGLGKFAERLAGAPDIESAALGSEIWQVQGEEIARLIVAGKVYSAICDELSPVFGIGAWQLETSRLLEALNHLPDFVGQQFFDRVSALASMLPKLDAASQDLAIAIGRTNSPVTLDGIEALVRVAERVSSAPQVDARAFASDLWETGIERASELVEAVNAINMARTKISGALADSAWSTDLSQARQILAGRGTDLFRFFSGEWRAAKRLVRSYMTEPKAALDRQLFLLDALAAGQVALRFIKANEELGRSAFANDWRADRSSNDLLASLVEWMRSLKDLGAEPRLVASKSPDQKKIARIAGEVALLQGEVAVETQKLWHDLGATRACVFGEATNAAYADITQLQQTLRIISNASSEVLGVSKGPIESLGICRHQLSRLGVGQSGGTIIDEGASIGASSFGSEWRGRESSWESLDSIKSWILANLDIHQLASRTTKRNEIPEKVREILSQRSQLEASVCGLLGDLKSDESCAISKEKVLSDTVSSVRDSLSNWIEKSELLSKWVDYRSRAQKAETLGLSVLVARLEQGIIEPSAALPYFEMSYFERVFAAQAKIIPELASFDGDLHNRTVRSFADLDTQRIRQSAFEVVSTHFKAIPSSNGGAVGPLGVLKGEIARKRGHMPIRQLIQKAGPAVQAIKPVFMMSPLSVAQFLPPGALKFDLLVMDEASQIQPVDALGAIARCKQVVVVGDPQQLPPTAFFAKITAGSDGGDTDEGAASVGDVESILGLFTARGLPTRMLRWHYRSRHESLIAVSNRQFYENKLYIVPSPHTKHSGLGLRFHHISDGIFETGTSRTNPVEAKAVAKAIIKHVCECPNLSLGVVAFSAAQRRAIQDQVELLRRTLEPKHEAFFQAHAREPFFIKNLENVQGDERDVIFISIGYGPTAIGARPPMRFGPVGQDGGERRLNVLISRAKRRCDVFSSMTDEDIDPDFASTRKGVFALKMFMHFARTGRITLAEQTGRDHKDVFEDQVAQALHERGYQLNRQVGVAGIFIDLAVVDPERPGRYILGIECDGSAYASARSARDRDRLRKAVLEDHGWSIYRIWSIDWFRRPKEQLERLIGAIEAAKAEIARSSDTPNGSDRVLEIVTLERDDVTEIGLVENDRTTTTGYVEARIAPANFEIHLTPIGMLAGLVEKVVSFEGPIYVEEIIARIRDAWGLKRAGNRIQEAIQKAIEYSVRQGRLLQEGQFYSLPGQIPVVRDRSEAESSGLRKPEALPPAEIRASLLEIISSNFGATEDQSVIGVSRAFGFKATSSQLREVIVEVINELVATEVLTRTDDAIELGPFSEKRVPRPAPPHPLTTLIQEGEHERLEFKETLRWNVLGKMVDQKLEEVAVKTIAAFANHSGGTLLIGVDDNGLPKGLGPDFASFKGGDRDSLELHLTNLINNHFSQIFRAKNVRVTFPTLDERMICRVDVERSRSPVYVKTKDNGGVLAERLFVRLGNASHEIPASQIAAYVNEHFS